jgi:hypothetical protein
MRKLLMNHLNYFIKGLAENQSLVIEYLWSCPETLIRILVKQDNVFSQR